MRNQFKKNNITSYTNWQGNSALKQIEIKKLIQEDLYHFKTSRDKKQIHLKKLLDFEVPFDLKLSNDLRDSLDRDFNIKEMISIYTNAKPNKSIFKLGLTNEFFKLLVPISSLTLLNTIIIF